MYRFTLPAAILASAASPLWADVPAVATDIAPVHALVSQVMEGVGTPDLIVTDINMPGISGLEFCKRVRNVAKHTPIIVMSALSDKGMVAEAKTVGVQGWMLKPVEPEYFLNKLKSILGETQALSS